MKKNRSIIIGIFRKKNHESIVFCFLMFFFYSLFNMNCFNCNRVEHHAAMCCPYKPQKYRRCVDCRAATRCSNDHSQFRALRSIVSSELDECDEAHIWAQPRLRITTSDSDGMRTKSWSGLVEPLLLGLDHQTISKAIKFRWLKKQPV